MTHKKMFVVYIQKKNKKERLYFKAGNIAYLIDYIYYETNYVVIQIKQLKRIYRKNDIFIEV